MSKEYSSFRLQVIPILLMLLGNNIMSLPYLNSVGGGQMNHDDDQVYPTIAYIFEEYMIMLV